MKFSLLVDLNTKHVSYERGHCNFVINFDRQFNRQAALALSNNLLE